MGLPNPGLTLEPGRTALVLTDLQNDFLSPGGNGWALFADSYARSGTVENLGRLLRAAKAAGLPVLVSPHYYYPTDQDWTAPGGDTEAQRQEGERPSMGKPKPRPDKARAPQHHKQGRNADRLE